MNYTHILLYFFSISFFFYLFLYYYFKEENIRIEEASVVKSIYPLSIKNDQSYFFVKTLYDNISFDQCIRTNDYVSHYIKTTGRWQECQDIFNLWKSSKKEGVFLDLGANIGSCSFLFAEVGIKVYAFEPLPNNLFLFSITTFTNAKFKKYITIYPYALGKEEKDEKIYIQKNNWGSSSMFVNNRDYNETIHVKKLDQFDKIIPKKISMIKIDVEIGEYDLLVGSRNFFKTHKAEYMYIEASCGKTENNGEYILEKLYTLLNEIGYDIIKKIDCSKIYTDNIIVKNKNLYK